MIWEVHSSRVKLSHNSQIMGSLLEVFSVDWRTGCWQLDWFYRVSVFHHHLCCWYSQFSRTDLWHASISVEPEWPPGWQRPQSRQSGERRVHHRTWRPETSILRGQPSEKSLSWSQVLLFTLCACSASIVLAMLLSRFFHSLNLARHVRHVKKYLNILVLLIIACPPKEHY